MPTTGSSHTALLRSVLLSWGFHLSPSRFAAKPPTCRGKLPPSLYCLKPRSRAKGGHSVSSPAGNAIDICSSPLWVQARRWVDCLFHHSKNLKFRVLEKQPLLKYQDQEKRSYSKTKKTRLQKEEAKERQRQGGL